MAEPGAEPGAEPIADGPAGPGLTLWLDPTFGAAGDMILGALIGLGASCDEVRAGLVGLDIGGWSLDAEPVLRGSLSATQARVETGATGAADGTDHHRAWSSIDALLAGADLPERVRRGARETFRRLGEVEAGIHRVGIDEVHFHEVGAVDAIIDIVGSWLAADLLGVGDIVAGPVGLGSGTTRAAHGLLPVPAPATAELLAGAPVRPLAIEAETVTPTGAALLTTMATGWGPIPPGRLLTTARGAGSRDPDGHPNVLSAHLIEPQAQPETASANPTDPAARSEPAVVVTTNLDDVTAEVVGHVIATALEAGADDAWASPITMKKNRPGIALSLLCHPDRLPALQALVFAQTATLGLRVQPADKKVLHRRFEQVTVRGHPIRIKVGPHGAKPEHDDLVALANRCGLPLRQLAAEAMAAHLATAPEPGLNRDHRPDGR